MLSGDTFMLFNSFPPCATLHAINVAMLEYLSRAVVQCYNSVGDLMILDMVLESSDTLIMHLKTKYYFENHSDLHSHFKLIRFY